MHIYTYTMQNTYWRNNKNERRLSLEKYTSHFIWKVCVWEGVGDRSELQHIDPHSIGHNRVSLPFSWAVQPGAWEPTLLGAGFLYHILSPTGLVSKLVPKLTDFLSSPSYIIVQSPTQYLPMTGHWDVSLPPSLEWHVWSSSSGNNCHAVHKSLSSGASVWLYIGILTLSYIVSQARLHQWNMQLPRLWNGMSGGVGGQYTIYCICLVFEGKSQSFVFIIAISALLVTLLIVTSICLMELFDSCQKFFLIISQIT